MNTDTEREAFEAWAAEQRLALNRHRHGYASTSTAWCWDAWQARASAPAPDDLSDDEVPDATLVYATNLAKSLASKFYPEVPQWRPLNDLLGVLTQIDNITAGLTCATREIGTTPKGWCKACGPGNDRLGYAHLESCHRAAPQAAQGAVEHVCGLQGFGAPGDVCPGCAQWNAPADPQGAVALLREALEIASNGIVKAFIRGAIVAATETEPQGEQPWTNVKR